MTIMYYMTLSLYRIQDDKSLLALFITFATINALYCCEFTLDISSAFLTTAAVWDLAMDWSLCQPDAKKRFLRNVRGYKPTWPYYLAMLIDPMLRFNWVPYVLYAHDPRYSAIASFLIAFSEVSRRGMWTLFRVENEHAANVATSHFHILFLHLRQTPSLIHIPGLNHSSPRLQQHNLRRPCHDTEAKLQQPKKVKVWLNHPAACATVHLRGP
jgi:EXS family